MRSIFGRTARRAGLGAALLLILGAIGVGALAYRALPDRPIDLRPAVEALAIARATAAAQAVEGKTVSIGLLLEALAERGGARPGRTRAMRLAGRAFRKLSGLEQLAAYSVSGKTRWVTRPAYLGSMLFPQSKAFVRAHLANADLTFRIGAPFQPRRSKTWWTPVTYIVRNKAGAPIAVLAAFMNQKTFAPLMADAGDASALLTAGGRLISAMPVKEAPIGASFAEAPGFALVQGQSVMSGVYEGQGPNKDPAGRIIGFAKLGCCGAVITAAVAIPTPPPPTAGPAVQWLTLSAAALMILLALGLIGRRLVYRAPNPWLDFGETA